MDSEVGLRSDGCNFKSPDLGQSGRELPSSIPQQLTNWAFDPTYSNWGCVVTIAQVVSYMAFKPAHS